MVKKFFESLDRSADARLPIMRASDVPIFVGETVFEIGRFMFCGGIRFAKSVPKATFGVVAGAVLRVLTVSVPLIGFVLGPIATPLAIILGTIWGAPKEISDAALTQEINREVRRFHSFRAA